MSRYQDAKERVVNTLLDPVLDLMKEANAAIEEAERRALQAEATLEALRPVRAHGFSSDSVAAQSLGNAVSEMWGILGVSNQTAAMERLRLLVAEKPANIWAERAAGTWHPGDEA